MTWDWVKMKFMWAESWSAHTMTCGRVESKWMETHHLTWDLPQWLWHNPAKQQASLPPRAHPAQELCTLHVQLCIFNDSWVTEGIPQPTWNWLMYHLVSPYPQFEKLAYSMCIFKASWNKLEELTGWDTTSISISFFWSPILFFLKRVYQNSKLRPQSAGLICFTEENVTILPFSWNRVWCSSLFRVRLQSWNRFLKLETGLLNSEGTVWRKAILAYGQDWRRSQERAEPER